MPTVSKKQERFMQAVANNPKFAKTVGVPTKVGKEFTKSGGGMKKSGNVKKMAFGGMGGKSMPPGMAPTRSPLPQALNKPGMAPTRSPLPQALNKPGMAPTRSPLPQALNKPGMMKKGGVVASKMGSVRTAAPSKDGVAVKGKTKGKQIVMKKGGMC